MAFSFRLQTPEEVMAEVIPADQARLAAEKLAEAIDSLNRVRCIVGTSGGKLCFGELVGPDQNADGAWEPNGARKAEKEQGEKEQGDG